MPQLVATIELDNFPFRSSSSSAKKISIRDEIHEAAAAVEPLASASASTSIPAPAAIASLIIEDGETPLAATEARKYLGKAAAIMLIVYTFLVYWATSLSTGLMLIGIPAIAADLSWDETLVFWPILIYSLTTAAFLLFAGTIADVVGRRPVNLISLFCLGVFVLACGFIQTGPQLVAFRAIGGVAAAFFLPTATSLISSNIPRGKTRNVGFSLLGAAQELGFASGQIIGGVFVSTVGWRAGFYLCGGLMLGLLGMGWWAVPRDGDTDGLHRKRQRLNLAKVLGELKRRVDWLGLSMASTSITLLAYVLARISVEVSNIKQVANITLLAIGIALVPACGYWFQYQEKNGRPALIPNSLWKRLPFTATCIMVLLAYAEVGSMDLLASLFFQEVQGLSAIQAALRLLPGLIMGAVTEFVAATIVHRVPAVVLVVSASILGTGAPLLMATIQPSWPYWWAAFPAQLLFPLCLNALFTVALLLISEVFSDEDQALAGAVFNVVARFGHAMGLALIGVITNAVTRSKPGGSGDDRSANALMEGYRAGFWTAFAWVATLCVIGAFGLRKVGKVGLKRD